MKSVFTFIAFYSLRHHHRFNSFLHAPTPPKWKNCYLHHTTNHCVHFIIFLQQFMCNYVCGPLLLRLFMDLERSMAGNILSIVVKICTKRIKYVYLKKKRINVSPCLLLKKYIYILFMWTFSRYFEGMCEGTWEQKIFLLALIKMSLCNNAHHSLTHCFWLWCARSKITRRAFACTYLPVPIKIDDNKSGSFTTPCIIPSFMPRKKCESCVHFAQERDWLNWKGNKIMCRYKVCNNKCDSRELFTKKFYFLHVKTISHNNIHVYLRV